MRTIVGTWYSLKSFNVHTETEKRRLITKQQPMIVSGIDKMGENKKSESGKCEKCWNSRETGNFITFHRSMIEKIWFTGVGIEMITSFERFFLVEHFLPGDAKSLIGSTKKNGNFRGWKAWNKIELGLKANLNCFKRTTNRFWFNDILCENSIDFRVSTYENIKPQSDICIKCRNKGRIANWNVKCTQLGWVCVRGSLRSVNFCTLTPSTLVEVVCSSRTLI